MTPEQSLDRIHELIMDLSDSDWKEDRREALRDGIEAYAALVRAAALEEAARACDEVSTRERMAYKGRSDPIDRSKLYNPHTDGLSDGAAECADAIRALARHGASAAITST